MSPDDDVVEEGWLTCSSCHARYPIRRSVPRFVPSDEYASAFSYEWTRHRRTQVGPESGSDQDFGARTGLTPDFATDKIVLDAGCGTGRHTHFAAQFAAQVVAVDLSDAVDVCQENEGWRDNVNVIQAEIGRLPLKDGSFDFIYSLGVLHHTPSTRESFLSLVPHLRPAGEIAIWVYDGHDKTWFAMSDQIRKITTRLPKNILYRIARINIPLYDLYMATPLRPLLLRIFTISMHPDPEWRVLDFFDWYGPKYQWKHTTQEVYQWFVDAGIDRVALAPHPVGVRGRKAEVPDATGGKPAMDREALQV